MDIQAGEVKVTGVIDSNFHGRLCVEARKRGTSVASMVSLGLRELMRALQTDDGTLAKKLIPDRRRRA